MYNSMKGKLVSLTLGLTPVSGIGLPSLALLAASHNTLIHIDIQVSLDHFSIAAD